MIEDTLSKLTAAVTALTAAITAAGGMTGGTTTVTMGTATKKTADKPKAEPGVTLEAVQDKIRSLVAEDEGNAAKIKAATASLGGKRAGDFEGDAAKLGKLMGLLEAITSDAAPAEDDDLL